MWGKNVLFLINVSLTSYRERWKSWSKSMLGIFNFKSTRTCVVRVVQVFFNGFLKNFEVFPKKIKMISQTKMQVTWFWVFYVKTGNKKKIREAYVLFVSTGLIPFLLSVSIFFYKNGFKYCQFCPRISYLRVRHDIF